MSKPLGPPMTLANMRVNGVRAGLVTKRSLAWCTQVRELYSPLIYRRFVLAVV
jgi:hypothetical protein